jgi:hypothetical protein
MSSTPCAPSSLTKNTILGSSNYEPRAKNHSKPQRFKIVGNILIDSTMSQLNPMVNLPTSLSNSSSGRSTSSSNSTTNDRFETSSNQIGNIHAIYQESKFAPKNVNQVLRFQSFYVESIDESNLEQVRLRKNTILLYLQDNTFEIIEPRTQNSGIPQGIFLKRTKLFKEQQPPHHSSESENPKIPCTNTPSIPYCAQDLYIGFDFPIFGRFFKLYDCDQFTRDFYTKEFGINVGKKIEIPKDDYTLTREQVTRLCGGEHDHFYGKKTYALKTYMEAALGNPIRSRLQSEKKRKFLANSRKVLCFYCEHDMRDQLYGDLMQYTLDFFLEDDTIEIKEILKANSGRDPFPLLLRRSRLLKNWRLHLMDEQDRGVEEPTCRESYYNEEDLFVGASINVFGREMKLVDADSYTRDYYQVTWGKILLDAQYTKMDKIEFKKPEPPPYNGYGTEEDSLGSCNSLLPKPPRKDFIKMAEFDRKLLRFQAKMISTRKEQLQRRFIFTYYLMDDTISIYEPEQRNSGMVCGKFLERGTYKTPEGERFSLKDFYLGAQVSFNGYRFEIIECDEYTKKFLAA